MTNPSLPSTSCIARFNCLPFWVDERGNMFPEMWFPTTDKKFGLAASVHAYPCDDLDDAQSAGERWASRKKTEPKKLLGWGRFQVSDINDMTSAKYPDQRLEAVSDPTKNDKNHAAIIHWQDECFNQIMAGELASRGKYIPSIR